MIKIFIEQYMIRNVYWTVYDQNVYIAVYDQKCLLSSI